MSITGSIRKSKTVKAVSALLALSLVKQLILPGRLFALTGGPAQPEFTSFESVGTSDMVNQQTGDFTYNLPLLEIPGPDGAGYPISLSYHSGASAEEDASWVGYGWTLNPGAVSRGKAGFPDDLNGEKIIYYNKVPKNWTVSLSGSVSTEAFSVDGLVGGGLNASVRYNNYRGFGYTAGLNMSVKGYGSLGYGVSDGEGSFSLQVNPGKILSGIKDHSKKNHKKTENASSDTQEKATEEKAKEPSEEAQPKPSGDEQVRGQRAGKASGKSSYGIQAFAIRPNPTQVTPYTGASVNVDFSVLVTTGVPVGVQFGFTGNYNCQTNRPIDRLESYGFMYLGNADEDDMMDYGTEREGQYLKRDHYLSIPLGSADSYMANGEGVGGGFRLHRSKVGHYRPNRVTSGMGTVQLGVALDGPLAFGVGVNVGVGAQTLTVREWDDGGLNFLQTGDEHVYFRMNNDPGGYASFGSTDATTAGFTTISGVPGFKEYDPDLSGLGITTDVNEGERSGRSGYVGYSTNAEMLQTSGGGAGYHFRAFTHNNYLLDDPDGPVDRSNIGDGIGEIAMVNEGGTMYLFGLPVYSRNEANLQYGLIGEPSSSFPTNHLAYVSRDTASSRSIVGEVRNFPYATQYLLTEILSPDYVDRKLDGPTVDDFGAWTKFSYERVYGDDDKREDSDDNWYKWRMPYNGMLYSRGELSSKMDDMGIVTYGEKEIYYLDTIQTRTHRALFYTEDRDDGMEAEHTEAVATADDDAKGTHKLKKLTKIELYAIDPGTGDDKLLKTVHFEYDYSAWPQIPNTDDPGSGKLTLRKVWFDFEGKTNVKVSPYIFYYGYPRTSASSTPECAVVDYPAEYDGLENYMTGAVEDPDYSPQNIDPWGAYEPNGAARKARFQTWKDQLPPSDYDPASWQLKSITLPTGGQIHVQYESDDYEWVQDRPVMVMISLLDEGEGSDDDDAEYILDLAGMGLTGMGQAVSDKIQDYYIDRGEKIFFKFLYSMVGTDLPDFDNCISEYLDGYAKIYSVNYDSGTGKVTLTLDNSAGHKIPKRLCQDYVRTSKVGKLDRTKPCNVMEDALSDETGPMASVDKLKSYLTSNPLLGTCQRVNFAESYFRIPFPTYKLGGDVRVRRILMYEPGMETDHGDAALYGTEYLYVMENGQSSGVASNEPNDQRVENPLVTLLDRDHQGLADKLIAGEDKKQMEGPIGESLLPSPNISYRRVVAKSIHDGATSPGFTVTEYYTTWDFPYDHVYPTLDDKPAFNATTVNKVKPGDWVPISTGVVDYSVNNIWLSQGYRFVNYGIYGLPRKISAYGGEKADIAGMGASALVSMQEYDYFKPGESLPIMRQVYDTESESWYPGYEMEVVMESRAVSDISVDGYIEGDLTTTPPLVFVSAMPYIKYDEKQMHSHVTSKVMHYPAIQRRTIMFENGIWHITENMAFNPHTGSPTLTRTTDGYHKLTLGAETNHNGYYHSFTIPASSQYSAVGQIASNQRARLNYQPSVLEVEKVVLGTGEIFVNIVTPGSGPSELVCDASHLFEEGDLVRLIEVSGGTTDGLYHVSEVNANQLTLVTSGFFAGTTTPGTTDVSVEIIKSGRSNQLSNNVGGFTTYGEYVFDTDDPISADLSAREAIVTLLEGVTDYEGDFSVDGCVFAHTQSNDPGIILSTDDDFIKVELVDHYTGIPIVMCTEYIPNTPGEFALDEQTGEIVFWSEDNECEPVRLDCLKFCETVAAAKTVTNVITAQAATLADYWPWRSFLYGTSPAGANVYETGEKGQWRVKGSYQYRDNIIGGGNDDPGSERVHADAGTFILKLFNYDAPVVNDPTFWLKASTVTAYSPYGMATEERDILGIYSTAKFGYHQTLPYLMAKNASEDEVFFESFENVYGTGGSEKVENGLAVTVADVLSTTAHSGHKSYEISPSSGVTLSPFELTDHILNKGWMSRLWVKEPNTGSYTLTANLSAAGSTTGVDYTQIARTGEWSLYEARVDAGALWLGMSLGDMVTPEITVACSGCELAVDDIRYQPLDAEMMCYVYDVGSFRLLTTFDDQHFGKYNQYDGQGRLVRVMVETERGMKTVQESQYHTPQVDRPDL